MKTNINIKIKIKNFLKKKKSPMKTIEILRKISIMPFNIKMIYYKKCQKVQLIV